MTINEPPPTGSDAQDDQAGRGGADPGGSDDAAVGDAGQEIPGCRDPGQGGLSDRDRAVLALERRGWAGPGAKERAIRERLGISPTRYYQLLNALMDDARALAHDPVTVNRLRRLREARRSRR